MQATVAKLLQDNHSIRETADMLHCGRGFVAYWKRKHEQPSWHAGSLLFVFMAQQAHMEALETFYLRRKNWRRWRLCCGATFATIH
jgi:hypothetical protein